MRKFILLICSLALLVVFSSISIQAEVNVQREDRLSFETEDGDFSLSIGGRLQPRYEYESKESDKSVSTFNLRRADLDFRGHIYNPDLTYRIESDAKSGALESGYLNYKVSPALEVQLGQDEIPWSWEGATSSNRHMIVETSVANSEFEWPDDDIGLLFHGELGDFSYGAAVMSGEGPVDGRADTATHGNLYGARLEYVPLGEDPKPEAILQPVESLNLGLGLGGYHARDNHLIDWTEHNGNNGESADRVTGYTADLALQTGRFTLQLQGFDRSIEPADNDDDIDGQGYTAGAGYLLRPEELFLGTRFSYSYPNEDDRETRKRETNLALQWFHNGHERKTHLEVGRQEDYEGDGNWEDTDLVRLQHQLLF